MTAAVAPGRVVNPDGAVAQVQGNIIMGLSSALLEEATVKDGALAAPKLRRVSPADDGGRAADRGDPVEQKT